MSARLKADIYPAKNKQWSWRVIRGARVIAVAGETYTTRFGVRRAVRAMAEVATDKSLTSYVSPLQAALLRELEREQAAWIASRRG